MWRSAFSRLPAGAALAPGVGRSALRAAAVGLAVGCVLLGAGPADAAAPAGVDATAIGADPAATASATAPAPAHRDFRWPAGVRAAVSLSYDDAIDSQLDNALPALDRAGLKATFYLTLSSPVVARRMAEYRAAAIRGHELGNHSLFHQCAGHLPDRAWVQPERDLDTTTAAQMRDQVLLANTMLAAIDGRSERTFTVPCGDHVAAGGRDYLPGVAPAFVGIKAGDGDGVVASMARLDPLAVPVKAPVGLSGRELIAIVERAGRQGTMVNFTFHGVGGDYLVTSRAAHDELVAWLAAHRSDYWTDTFLTLMRYVRTEQATTTEHDPKETTR